MIGYVMLGTNDVARANALYGPLLSALGMAKNDAFSGETRTFYAPTKGPGPLLAIGKPYDQQAASNGNGTMVALQAPSRAVIAELHAAALAAGATDEGAPGERGAPFYGAYFRDHDGNKVCLFTMGG